MIGSHDSLTYDKPLNILMNLISIFWRTQNLDISKQYEAGVRIFDIRVSRYNNMWYGAHGIYKCKNIKFKSISDICKQFKNEYPDTIIRIYLENNVKNKNKDILDLFLKESEEAYNKYESTIWEIGTHFPWVSYYKNLNLPFNEIKSYHCNLFNWDPNKSFWYNITHFDFSNMSIKKHAKKHNPIIDKELIDSKTLHFMDFINIIN